MKYRVNWQGRELGEFTLEELRRRRQMGELRGTEWVLPEGGTEWKALDFILDPSGHSPSAVARASADDRKWWARPLVWAVGLLILLFLGGLATLAIFGYRFAQRMRPAISAITQISSGSSEELAGKPINISSNSLTETSRQKQRKAFRARQFLDGFKNDGPVGKPWNEDAIILIESWLAESYGGNGRTNLPPTGELAAKMFAAGCDDPLVFALVGTSTRNNGEAIRRLKQAVAGFPQSRYKAYPRLYATVSLANKSEGRPKRIAELDASAMELLDQAFQDGSFRPEDAVEIAEIFSHGWGEPLLNRNPKGVLEAVKAAGKDYEWLQLVVEGKSEILAAWKARGGGYSDTVSQRGWQGFSEHSEQARVTLTKAWEMRPDQPLPAAIMVRVAMGQSSLAEMRQWFDRATAAQFDHPQAWSHLRWGMRPRWHGSHEALLALGRAALNTERFDTDVPRQFIEVVWGIQSDEELAVGENIYGRGDIWPELRKMFEGYIGATSGPAAAAWRSDYAAVAYMIGRHDVARKQLEALQWKPEPPSLKHWGRDLSAMAGEVAARTGPSGKLVAEAESARKQGNLPRAAEIYSQLAAEPVADEVARRFIRSQVALVDFEQRLAKGGWVDFLPAGEDDTWAMIWGKVVQATTNRLEIESDVDGHLLYSRANVGPDFEVRGEWEFVGPPGPVFKAGLVMGMPDCDPRYRTSHWFVFEVRRGGEDGDTAVFSKGWTQNRVTYPIRLDPSRNSFLFRFEDWKATVSINREQVFRNVALRNTEFASENFLVGVMVFGERGGDVIRYHNLQLRQLPRPVRSGSQ